MARLLCTFVAFAGLCAVGACGDTAGAEAAARGTGQARLDEGATLVLTNADGTEEKVPYRECTPAQHQTLTALVGPVFMQAVRDEPALARQGGFTAKIHLAVRASGALVFGGASAQCGGEECPRGDAKGIEALARNAVSKVEGLKPPPAAPCVTSVNVRMQSKIAGP